PDAGAGRRPGTIRGPQSALGGRMAPANGDRATTGRPVSGAFLEASARGAGRAGTAGAAGGGTGSEPREAWGGGRSGALARLVFRGPGQGPVVAAGVARQVRRAGGGSAAARRPGRGARV